MLFRPTNTPTLPLAIVKENAQHVNLLEGPFGHCIAAPKNGIIAYRCENTVLREDLPTGMELQVLGQYFDCAILNVRLPDGSLGWVERYAPNFPYSDRFGKLSVNLECASIPEGIYRPWTGSFGRAWMNFENTDLDRLTILNDSEYDILAVLADENSEADESIYVRAGEEFSLALLGERFIFVAMGQDWLVNSHRFNRTIGQYKTIEPISKNRDWASFNPSSEKKWTIYTLTIRSTLFDEAWIRIDQFPIIHIPGIFPPTAVP